MPWSFFYTFPHYHAKSQELYYVLRGKGRIYVGKKSAFVKKDDTILIMPKQKHKIKNIGTSNLVFLCMCSPSYEHTKTHMVGIRIATYVHSRTFVP